ncbi:MAG: ABC transporter ATP-binding protein [Eubacteriales bacterium]|nr:ABC transporter ATP-binding protein [Eubacteriales bacterium]MDD3074234.1 ABC transporter ATP-binding protein [Eubacteriales bacterium]MDD4079426.1 ABC transporter ATP-binding protein [Eubacteriales bacterium]MDD4769297.1 ABC transporter ATP-binding protein [Eubacteriales bacterium]
MKKNLIEIKDLEVIYKTDLETVYAVNKISFSVKRGETLGIVGETGAGKTTMALSLLRLLPERTGKIVGGSISYAGKDLLALSEKDMQRIRGEKISMIFQDPMTALNPVITVGKQIAESLILHNDDNKTRDEIEERVEQSLEMVGIPAFRKKEYPHQFSGGMKQRVVIAIALACKPELLIADEPTTALDVTIQAQVLAMMNELKERLGTAMLMITHDLGVVAQTCDNVAIMYAGEIIEYGSMEEIFSADEHHPYTEGLFGSIPDLESDEPRLHPIKGLMPDPTNLPKGCKFSPRCPKCMDICREQVPEDYVDGTHTIRCHLFAGKVRKEKE